MIGHDNNVSKNNHTGRVKGPRRGKVSNRRLGALNVVLKWKGEEPSSFTKILVDRRSCQYCSMFVGVDGHDKRGKGEATIPTLLPSQPPTQISH